MVQGIATEQSYWIALTLTPGLLDHFGDIAHIF
jgi:hypothetical protein